MWICINILPHRSSCLAPPITHSSLHPDASPATVTLSHSSSPKSAYFAVCAAIKDTPANVKEWVDYHSALGVGKFYLMDTDDPNPSLMETTLRNHIASGLVELFPLPRVNPQTINLLQVRLYAACLDSVRDHHQFIGFWDVDEFLIPVHPKIIHFPTFLREFEHYGGLAVGWRVVGPSGHVKKPPQGKGTGTMASYTLCTKWDFLDNEEIKTIVNTKYAINTTSDPHTFVYRNGAFAVDAEMQKVEGSRNAKISTAWREFHQPPRVALYHYVIKSEEEYKEKMNRGSAMGNRKDWRYFERINEAAREPCEEAVMACRNVGLSLEYCSIK